MTICQTIIKVQIDYAVYVLLCAKQFNKYVLQQNNLLTFRAFEIFVIAMHLIQKYKAKQFFTVNKPITHFQQKKKFIAQQKMHHNRIKKKIAASTVA